MTVVQSITSPFVFPDPSSDMIRYDSGSSSLSSSFSDTTSYLGSIKGSSQSQNQHRFELHSPNSYFPHKRSSSFHDQSKPTNLLPPPFLTIDSLIQHDISYLSSKSIAATSAAELSQLILHHNILNRLYVSLYRFQTCTSESPSRYDSAKFASSYQQTIELSAMLKDDFNVKPAHFSSLLKYNQRELLNSFLTLLKSAPSFISTSLLSMSSSDLLTFLGTSSSSSPTDDDILSLHRSKPLDILYYSIFPPGTPTHQKYEYFSSICVSLIEHKRATNICFAIFDRVLVDIGSPFKSSLENILYTILQEGSFLCSSSSSASNRVPVHPASSTSTSEYPSPELGNATLTLTSSTSSSLTATGSNSRKLRKPSSISLSTSSTDEPTDLLTQEFLKTSVELIVEFLDNKSTEGIPLNFLKFVKSVLKKLPEQSRRSATLLIVVKYFFSVHVRRLILYPERLGMLSDYYICENQRKKVLTLVFNKLYQLVMSYVYGVDQEGSVVNSSIHEKTKRYLESIVMKFGEGTDSATSGASTTTSGTVSSTITDETHPLPPESLYCSPGQFFILSPSDIISLYSALFPSFALRHRSPIENQRRPYMFSSIAASHTTSLPTIDSSYTHLGLESDNESMDDSSINSTPILGPSEDYAWSLEDIKTDLEPVIEELIKKFPYLQFKDNSQYLYSLRPNKLQNFRMPHPLSEKWQIFQVNNDSTINDIRPDSILEHIYRISFKNEPKNESDDQLYSLPVAPANRSLVPIIKKSLEKLVTQTSISPYENDTTPTTPTQQPSHSYLYDLLSNAMEKANANNKFLDANEYSNALNALKKLLPNNNNTATYTQVSTSVNNYIISLIDKEKKFNLNRIDNQIELCRSQCIPSEIQLQLARKKCEYILSDLSNLRTKVWYSTEIRNSALWTRARDVALALNNINNTGINIDNNTNSIESPISAYSPIPFPSLKRNNSSSSVSSLSAFSFKRFTSNPSKRDYNNRRHSIISSTALFNENLMFAAKELGGIYKLSDREASATKKWLQGQNIQNFCTGEERIHRFCCEVDDLIKRIMGDALSSQKNKGHSLLSSSLLFRNDLWKLIVEVEGSSRSSTPSINPSYGHRASIGATNASDNEASDFTHIRIPRPSTDRSSSYRGHGHRSQKSTPNFLEVFTSLDSNKATNYSAENYESVSHRRNRSLNETTSNPVESFDSLSMKDELTLLDGDAKRRELDETILTLQMKLTSLIYTDIGTNCFYDGKFPSPLSPT